MTGDGIPPGYLVIVPSSGPDLNPHGSDLRKACRVGRALNPAYSVSPGQVIIAMCPRDELNHLPTLARCPMTFLRQSVTGRADRWPAGAA
jgi:hypothetical protein